MSLRLLDHRLAVVKQAKAEGKSEDDAEVQRAKATAEQARIEKEAAYT